MKIKLTNLGFLCKRKHLVFIMRTFIFLFCATVFSFTSNNVVSQNSKVKIEEDKILTVDEVFEIIKNQTDYKFIYEVGIFKNFPKVEVKKGTISTNALLNKSLSGGHLNIIVTKDNTIIIKDANPDSYRDQQQVTGKVTDAAGLPVPGVTVLIKGTGNGTVTDFDGNYSITIPNPENVLVFSYLGSITQEITVGEQTTIDVILKEATNTLEEVTINAGYYKTTQREATGNISRVDAKIIEKQPVSNPLAALQGRVPGLQITQATGVPGGNFSVRIRGQNSIANGNDPLFVIDGVPFTSISMASSYTSGQILTAGTSPLNNINPEDIQSIEILKDADATAIYGSRGANGIVLITTKKGKEGKTKIDLNFYTGVGRVASKIDLLSTKQYLEMRREAYANDGRTPTGFSARDLLVWDTTRYTDWQKKLIGGTAKTVDGQISMSGGNKNTQFLVGGGYHKETTVFPSNNGDQRGSIHFNLSNSSINQKLKSTFSASYSTNKTNLYQQDLTGTAMLLPPNAPAIYNTTGELNWENSTWTNPFSYLKRTYESNTSYLLGNSVISYAILPSLEIKANLGYTNTSVEAITTIPISSYNPAFASFLENETAFSNGSFKNWIIEPQINWIKNTNGGKIDVLIGMTFLEEKSEKMAQIGKGFSSEQLMKNILAASSLLVLENNISEYRYNAIYGRINYNLNEKYIINLTGRRDGSSRFGPDKQFANFGAIGTAWVFSKEKFIERTFPFLSYGKIRASYGSSGNDQLGDYKFLDRYTTGGPYQGTNGLIPVSLFNPDFAWEINKKLEGSINLGFVNDRIFLSLSYYRNQSSNQLVGYSLPPTTGFSEITSNLQATVQNTGTEFELNTVNIKNYEFSWTTSFNLTIPRNKLIKYPNIEGSSYANRYVIGQPLSISKLYNFLEIDPQTGVYKFQDLNSDGDLGTLDQESIVLLGDKVYGGLSNNIQYKGFQIDIFFQFVNKNSYNYLYDWAVPPGGISNQPVLVMDRWQQINDISSTQRFTRTFDDTWIAHQNAGYSNKAVSNASFIRIKNAAIGYSLPENWLKKIHFDNAKVFLQGQNLVTISNYKGLDPETGNASLPPIRTVAVGFHLTF